MPIKRTSKSAKNPKSKKATAPAKKKDSIREFEIVSNELILSKICMIRGHKVLLDFHLADLFGVSTKALKQAVKRNKDRFPLDFIFELTSAEMKSLRSQFVTLKTGHGQHTKYKSFAFTEQGVAMLSGVLNSKTAIRLNIQIVRLFIKMCELLMNKKDVLLYIEKQEARLNKHDEDIAVIFKYLKQLLQPPNPPRRQIGFRGNNAHD
ncbi:MAG TPA: ORF6N domain-containing protein [Chitinophagaceae bacterium]|jgi:phage regulator Rha-like protein|nr:ORF6N domain-containing protein [Chitinophagaceae bacterium]